MAKLVEIESYDQLEDYEIVKLETISELEFEIFKTKCLGQLIDDRQLSEKSLRKLEEKAPRGVTHYFLGYSQSRASTKTSGIAEPWTSFSPAEFYPVAFCKKMS